MKQSPVEHHEPGDLVKYMSRLLLVIKVESYWMEALELGTTTPGRYLRTAVRKIN